MTEREFVDAGMVGRATFSDEEPPEYRYRLERRWDTTLPTVLFVMLNPSTATETVPDPTITRCVGYAKAWGYGRLFVGNLFALRSTNPTRIRLHGNPVGPGNDEQLVRMAGEANLVVCAWGVHGADRHWQPGGRIRRKDRGDVVAELLRPVRHLYCLGATKDGHPKHPLYLPKTVTPERYGV